MRKQIQKSRRFRHGSVSVILTVLVFAATILLNTAFETLAKRYSWYTAMDPSLTFDVTDDAFALLGRAFAAQTDAEPVEILFCNTEEKVLAGSSTAQIYHTASSLAERFPDRIRIRFTDILTNPSSVKSYQTTTDVITGKESSVAIASTSVIIRSQDYHRVYSAEEFYIRDDSNSEIIAYNGERKMAAGILHAIDNGTHVVCVTDNHGEAYYDSEVLNLLDDAGYAISMIDLQADEIPENCDLILCFNPNTDLVDDEISSVSEIQVLEDYLSKPGKNFLAFLERGTPSLPNLESFLQSWGVGCGYTKPNESKISYRYSVQDAAHALTSDNSTFYGKPVRKGESGEMLEGISEYVVFKNATALEAAQGFVNHGDGSYSSGGRTLYSLYEMNDSALSFANGAIVSNARGMLLTLTEQTVEGGKSAVCVIPSVDFCTKEYLQSAVYGNTEIMMRLFSVMGKANTTEGLTYQPVRSTGISIVTTGEMLTWTLSLVLIPSALIAAIGILIFAKRRRG